MGEHEISTTRGNEQLRSFVRALLEDLRALERMIEGGLVESGVRRIGAEQEMFLVDGHLRPSNSALQLLERLGDGAFTTELALFNLEANLSPCTLGGGCLMQLEQELEKRMRQVREAAAGLGVRPVLAGILPTIEQENLGLDSMTPNPRYLELNGTMRELRGGRFTTLIKGVDELSLEHDNVMLEACNTSFQIHFQVGPDEFASLYNLAQVVTAPVLAAAVNSPVLLQHRLWKETRVALFQQSLDTRSKVHQARGMRQRVSFGDDWVHESVLEIFREDVARFRVLIAGELDESPMDVLDRGEIPRLRALCLHNGTVYRWNRPCYGVNDGVAHLRIENRVLPAGPTVIDEVANAAFYFGLMTALGDEYGDIRRVMEFDHAKANFLSAARYGLKARFDWVGGRTWTADQLILEHLLPLARQGLAARAVASECVERYLAVIEERVKRGRTGSQWAFDSLARMAGKSTRHARYRALTAAIVRNQVDGRPVHEWELADLEDGDAWPESYRTVGQVMSTDLFTVHPEDLVDLAANLMDWRHIRHVPVEDSEGRLVGIVSHRSVLRMVGRGLSKGKDAPIAVHEVMRPDPITIGPDASTLDAIARMREHKVSCLPVVADGRLVGIVTEHDFIAVAAKLLEEKLREA